MLTSSLFIPEILLLRGSFNQFDIFLCVFNFYSWISSFVALVFGQTMEQKTGRSFPKKTVGYVAGGYWAVTGITCLFRYGIVL